MIEYIKTTANRFNNLKFKLDRSFFQMDNARPHTAKITQRYFDQRGIELVKQSPYSPDLNLCDRFLFRAIKVDLNNQAFSGPKEVEIAVKRSIRGMSENALCKELQKLYDHCKMVIELGGDYVSSV